MGKLSKPDIFEAAFWLLLAVVFFAVSFSFNQPIEIYKFGATGWPRVILFLMALIALGNFYHAYTCLLYTSPSPRDKRQSRMPSSA